MKITLISEDSIRLEPTTGPMTIEAKSPDQLYSPFHMVAGGLAFCTYSVLASWASNAKLASDDIAIDVRWTFADNPHRVGDMALEIEWPSLPQQRRPAAERVASLCAIHATLTHSPNIVTTVAAGTNQHEAPATTHPGRPYTVVYDGYCKVCKRLVAVLLKWDRRAELEILPSQTPGLAARYPWIPAKAYLESVQFIENRTGKTWQGAAALEQIIDALPKGRLITWIFSIPLARPLAEKFYRWFAKNRYRLGCGEHCQLHEADLEYPQ